MPVDVSFYNRPIPDALSSVGSAVGVANGLLQNRITQQEMRARQAVGNAFQGSVLPDGSVDTGALGSAIQGSPDAAWGAADALQKAASLRQTQLANQGQEVGQSQARVNDFYGSLGPLLANGGSPTYSQVIGLAGDLMRQGRLKPADMGALVSEIPRDGKSLADYAQNKFGSTLSPAQQASPGPIVTSAEGQTTPTVPQFFRSATSPKKGPVAHAADGSAVQTDSHGNAVQNPPASNAAAAAPNVPGMQTGPAMGTGENIKANIDEYQKDQKDAGTRLASTRNLIEALPIIRKAGPNAFGPGSRAENEVKQALISQGFMSKDDQNAPLPQILNKFFSRYIAQNPGADRSDMAQGLASLSNPNTSIGWKAALQLTQSAIGFDRMDSAAAKAYALQHPNEAVPGTQYLSFKRDYQNDNDPKAFAFDQYEGPDERGALMGSIGAKGSDSYKKFNHSLHVARDTNSTQFGGGSQ